METKIPNNAKQIQIGLYWKKTSFIIGGVEHYYSRLYASEGYHFYDKDAEYLNSEGNKISFEEVPYEERLYMEYCTTNEINEEELNRKYCSVLKEN